MNAEQKKLAQESAAVVADGVQHAANAAGLTDKQAAQVTRAAKAQAAREMAHTIRATTADINRQASLAYARRVACGWLALAVWLYVAWEPGLLRAAIEWLKQRR